MEGKKEEREWLEKVRADCPPCREVVHLNNAGSSLPPKQVVDRQVEYLREEANLGGYELAASRYEGALAFYDRLSALFGGAPHQYSWHTSATDAYNRALSSIPWSKGDSLLTTRNDYTSNHIAFLQLRQSQGIDLIVADDRPEGGVDLADLEKKLHRFRPRLVAVTQVPSHAGLVQPVAAIGELCRNYDCWYLVDGCQAAGQIPLDLVEMRCDFFAGTFRKFLRGPRGAGFLYVSDRALDQGLEPGFLDLFGASWTEKDQYKHREDAKRFELWERSFVSVWGSIEALSYLQEVGPERASQRIAMLSVHLQKELQSWAPARILYPEAKLRGIVSVHFPGQDPRRLLKSLRQERIHISIAWAAGVQWGMDPADFPWALRFSPHYYNTEKEIEIGLEALKALLK